MAQAFEGLADQHSEERARLAELEQLAGHQIRSVGACLPSSPLTGAALSLPYRHNPQRRRPPIQALDMRTSLGYPSHHNDPCEAFRPAPASSPDPGLVLRG